MTTCDVARAGSQAVSKLVITMTTPMPASVAHGGKNANPWSAATCKYRL